MKDIPFFLKVGGDYNFDGEMAFILLLELGTFIRVAGNLRQNGVLDPKTNEPYKVTSCRYYTWKWLLQNPNRSWEIIQERNIPITRKYWEQFLVVKAYSRFVIAGKSRKRFYKWLEENGLEAYKGYRKSKYFEDKEDI